MSLTSINHFSSTKKIEVFFLTSFQTGVQSSSFTLDPLPRSTSSFFTSNSDMENDNFNAIQLINNAFVDLLGFCTTQV